MIYTKYRLAPHHDIHPQSSVARIALATWRAVALVLTMALVFTSPCRAAAQPLSGTITDALGRPLAGVNVELRNENGRTVAHAVTEHAGHFTMGPANPGIYSLDAGKPGFKSAIKIVQLPRNSAEQISIALDAGDGTVLADQGDDDSRAQRGLDHRREQIHHDGAGYYEPAQG